MKRRTPTESLKTSAGLLGRRSSCLPQSQKDPKPIRPPPPPSTSRSIQPGAWSRPSQMQRLAESGSELSQVYAALKGSRLQGLGVKLSTACLVDRALIQGFWLTALCSWGFAIPVLGVTSLHTPKIPQAPSPQSSHYC